MFNNYLFSSIIIYGINDFAPPNIICNRDEMFNVLTIKAIKSRSVIIHIQQHSFITKDLNTESPSLP